MYGRMGPSEVVAQNEVDRVSHQLRSHRIVWKDDPSAAEGGTPEWRWLVTVEICVPPSCLLSSHRSYRDPKLYP